MSCRQPSVRHRAPSRVRDRRHSGDRRNGHGYRWWSCDYLTVPLTVRSIKLSNLSEAGNRLAQTSGRQAAACALSVLRFPSPKVHQHLAIELARFALRPRGAEHDLLRRLEGRKPIAAIAEQLTDIDRHARPSHHVAHHLLAVDRVRHADGGDLDQLGAPHQEAVDLDRRDVYAAADDEVLRATGEAEKAVDVETPEIAGAEAAATVDLHATVVGEIAVVVAGFACDLEAADFHLPDLAGRQRSALGIDHREAVIGE